MQPACQAYRAVLSQLHSAPYAVQAAAFWAIEACYNQAWAKVLNDGTAELYKEFAHRWACLVCVHVFLCACICALWGGGLDVQVGAWSADAEES